MTNIEHLNPEPATAASNVTWHETYDPPARSNSTPTEHETLVIARKLRYDLTAMQAKVTDLLTALARLDLPNKPTNLCPVEGCGYRPSINMPSLAEHAHQVHGAPIPDHWVQADARAQIPARPAESEAAA